MKSSLLFQLVNYSFDKKILLFVICIFFFTVSHQNLLKIISILISTKYLITLLTFKPVLQTDLQKKREKTYKVLCLHGIKYSRLCNNHKKAEVVKC